PSTPSPATPTGCGGWPLTRPATGWPPPATTTPYGSGTPKPAPPSTPSPAIHLPTAVVRDARQPLTPSATFSTLPVLYCPSPPAPSAVAPLLSVWGRAPAPPSRCLPPPHPDPPVPPWPPESGPPLHTLTGHTDWVRALATAPAGRWLASASDDHTVRIWDPQ